MTTVVNPVVLEPAARAVAHAAAQPPLLYELTVSRRGRCSTTCSPHRSTSRRSTSSRECGSGLDHVGDRVRPRDGTGVRGAFEFADVLRVGGRP
jgi:hypothetical protein